MRRQFNEAKATQIAAQLLRLRGGKMSYLKLIKLMYVIDREALRRWGRSVSTDRHVSMPKGPVLSRVLNLITEEQAPGEATYWSEHIQATPGYSVHLISDPGDSELSRAEEQLIEEVFAAHGHKTRWQLVEELHYLPEWQDPNGSSLPIATRDILAAVGKDAAEIEATEEELDHLALAEALLRPV